MAKFTNEEKMKAVKRYLEGNEGCRTIAKEMGVHFSKLQFWARKYEYHGEKAFSKSYANYSLQYKLDVLHYMNENGTSIFETAVIFNMPSDSTLWTWQHLLETQGLDALKSKKKGRPSMKHKDKKKMANKYPLRDQLKHYRQKMNDCVWRMSI